MPKGVHLYIYFNANLSPGYLLGIAKGILRMFVNNDRPLLSKPDYDTCKIRFLIRFRVEEEKDGRT